MRAFPQTISRAHILAALPFVSALLCAVLLGGVAVPLALAKPYVGGASSGVQSMAATIDHLQITARYRLDYSPETIVIAKVEKDQGRFIQEDPWAVNVIPTVTFRRDEYERVLPRPRPKRKRSSLDTESVPLETPFGVTIRTRVSLSGIPRTMTDFLKKVQAKCGVVTVTSAFRPGARVAGSRRISCHAVKQAIDYTIGNPSCALTMAKQWRGGHSVDYHTAPGGRHFHISTCRQEKGARFVHRGSTRYAKKRSKNIRVARAN